MTQDYEMIGQASAELEAIAQQYQGWGPSVFPPTSADTVEPMTEEMTDRTDYSFRDRRANMQLMRSGSMAGHVEPPMAGIEIQPERPVKDVGTTR